MYPYRAFSLLELLIVISIIAICCAFAIPALSTLVASTRARTETQHIIAALQFARSAAIKYGKPIIYCKSVDHKTCSGTWSDGQIIFIAPQKKDEIEQGGTILRVFYKVASPGKLIWRGFISSDYLQINPTGFPHEQDGSFYYCTGLRNQLLSKAIIISRNGRIRVTSAEKTDFSC